MKDFFDLNKLTLANTVFYVSVVFVGIMLFSGVIHGFVDLMLHDEFSLSLLDFGVLAIVGVVFGLIAGPFLYLFGKPYKGFYLSKFPNESNIEWTDERRNEWSKVMKSLAKHHTSKLDDKD